jgi:AraC-like DNA-binding protein
MVTTPSFDTVNPNILGHFSAVVRDLGGNPNALLMQAEIDPASFGSSTYQATYRQIVRLVAQASVELHCRDFGMRLAEAQAESIRSPLLRLFECCQTLGDALQQVSTHSYAHSPAASIWLRHLRSDETVALGHDILLGGLPQRAQAMEQILLVAYLIIRKVTGGRVRARRICFRHQPISPLSVYHRHFGCEVRFDQQADTILFHRRDMSCPTEQPDERSFNAIREYIATQYLVRPPLHATVRGMVMNLLGTELCRNEFIADALGLNVRGLHRHLAAEGTSFQRIKIEVLRDQAIYYLELTELDLTVVSERLGFAEQSILTHFCQKWLGTTPSRFRSRGSGTKLVDREPAVPMKRV